MSTTEELYGMSNKELNFILYQEIVHTLQKAQNVGYSEDICALLINDEQVSKRLSILKDRRFSLTKNGFLAMTKEEEVIVDKITKAIDFWGNFVNN